MDSKNRGRNHEFRDSTNGDFYQGNDPYFTLNGNGNMNLNKGIDNCDKAIFDFYDQMVINQKENKAKSKGCANLDLRGSFSKKLKSYR